MKQLRDWAGRELSLWLVMTVPTLVVTSLTTVLLRRGQVDLPVLGALGAALLLSGVGWMKLAPPSLQRLPMLAVLNFFALSAGGAVAPDTASAFTGFFLVTFCFVGLSRGRGTALLLVPVALPGWLLDSSPVTSTTLAKLPVAVGCWILVGELIASFRTQQKKVQDDLERQLERDALTGLQSRRNLDERLRALSPTDTVVFLDLDHFKAVNDSHGHAAGDQVLMQFASAISMIMKTMHEAIRYGGEEILVLLKEAGPADAEEMLRQLRGVWRQVRPEITFSAGVAAVSELGGSEAVQRADAAMYRAKNDGRNRWHVAEPVPGAEIPAPATDDSVTWPMMVPVPPPRSASLRLERH